MAIRSLIYPSAPHDRAAPVVRLSDVTVRYNGGEPALLDASFTVQAGEPRRRGGSQRRWQEHTA